MSARKISRWIVVVGVLALTTYKSVGTFRDYQACQTSLRIGDRSAADFYGLQIKLDYGEIFVAWCFSAALIYLLRPKQLSRP